jgi:hypothetical protein
VDDKAKLQADIKAALENIESKKKRLGPRRVFDALPYSSETFFKVKLELTGCLRGYHYSGRPELAAQEILESVENGELRIDAHNLGINVYKRL